MRIERPARNALARPPSASPQANAGRGELYVALDQQYITNAEFQDVHDHAGRTFTLLGDSDRACYYSRFHPPAMRDLRIYGKDKLLGAVQRTLEETVWC